MRRSFNINLKAHARDPRQMARIGLGILLAANLVAAWFVFQTPGGTPEQLESDLIAGRNQLIARQQSLARLKKVVEKAAQAREQGDRFLDSFFLPRRHAYSTLEIDLANAARSAGIRSKERTYGYEPVEGSDTLGMLNINANFEGTYADLMSLVNAIDRSKRLIIIEQLQAQPQQGTNLLAVVMKLNTFFRMDGSDEAPQIELIAASEPRPATPPQAVVPPPQPRHPQPETQRQAQPQPPPPQVSEPRSGPLPVPPRQRTFPVRPRQPREIDPRWRRPAHPARMRRPSLVRHRSLAGLETPGKSRKPPNLSLRRFSTWPGWARTLFGRALD